MAVAVRLIGDLIRIVVRSGETQQIAEACGDTPWYETLETVSRRDALRLIKQLLDALDEAEPRAAALPVDMGGEIQAERARLRKLTL